MRNRIFLFAALFAAVSVGTSCDKILPGITVNDVKAEASFVVNPGPGGDVESSGQKIDLDLESIMSDNGASGFKVTEATLTGIEFKAEDGNNFDAFEKASAWIGAVGHPDKEVAKKDNIDNGLTSITLDVEPTDMLPYVESNDQSFKAKVFVSEPIHTARTVKAILTYKLVFSPQ